MNFDALVDEIVARVSAKIAQQESCGSDVGKPKLLILTEEHGSICHDMLESERLLSYYQTECALLKDYDCDMASYEAVILFGLTNEALARLAGGVCDTPFTRLAQKAILTGKKIFVLKEIFELYRYAETAPPAYYAVLEKQLALLQQAGVAICPLAELEDATLCGEAAACEPAASPAPCAAAPCAAPGREVKIEKRVITERDLSAVYDKDVSVIHIGKRAILTDLAKEYAQARKVSLVRDE